MSFFLEKPNHARDKAQQARDTERAWQALRRYVLQRDDHRCRACGLRAGVDVHHLKFRSVGGAHTKENCCALCRSCHADLHGYRLALDGNAERKLRITRRG